MYAIKLYVDLSPMFEPMKLVTRYAPRLFPTLPEAAIGFAEISERIEALIHEWDETDQIVPIGEPFRWVGYDLVEMAEVPF